MYSEWDVAPSRCGIRLDLRTVHTGKSKLTLGLQSGVGELYNMHSDPKEMKNLWNEPSSAELQRQMLRLLWSRPDIVLDEFDDPIGVA